MKFDRDDIKLSFERPSYSVNAKKKTVTCVLRYTVVAPTVFDPTLNAVFDINRWCGEYKSVGVAVCGDNDKFDEKTGCEIAEARAEAKAYIAANNKIEKFIREFSEKLYNWQSNFAVKAGKIVKHNDEFIQRIG